MDGVMAEGRMLKKEISDSGKLGRLKSDRARVLWFMMLPHLDRDGRLKADPQIIKGQICTMLPYSLKTIQTALEQLHDIGLIILYQANGDQCLQYTRFSDFQSLKYDRESESKIPEPNPENSGVILRTPPEVKLKEVNISKENIGKTLFLDFVFLTEDEYTKLKGSLGKKSADDWIAELNGAIGSKGYKYKSHYLTILNWDRKAKKSGNTRTDKRKTQRTTNRPVDYADQESQYGQTIE
jgi:hypothetical protein